MHLQDLTIGFVVSLKPDGPTVAQYLLQNIAGSSNLRRLVIHGIEFQHLIPPIRADKLIQTVVKSHGSSLEILKLPHFAVGAYVFHRLLRCPRMVNLSIAMSETLLVSEPARHEDVQLRRSV